MLMHFYIEIHLFERPLSSSKEISRRIAGMTVYALDHKINPRLPIAQTVANFVPSSAIEVARSDGPTPPV
jgi:hypothetical protein